jgi:histidinol-phosphate/aromatic aminotransferase/cobyric acid decarboxylase-like protein
LARRVAAALATATLAQAYTEPLLAASAANGSVESAANGWIPEGAVKINANENPLGPCPEAAEAIYSVIRQGGRYLYESTFEFTNTLAAQEGLIPEYVKAFAGSSDPLHRTVLAFTNPTRSFVAADPGYEAGGRAAMFSGAQTILVPLSSSWAHDVKAMAAADASAGVIYVCNPNNPTGTLTSRADLEWLVDNKPAGAVVLLDEAYLHFTEASPATDLVAADKDIIVLRSFSKLYGMAGLRAGAALARPDLLAKIKPYAAGALPVTGMVGATASLRSKTVVPERRKLMRSVREDVFSCLSRNNIRFIPSESNCFMLDAQRPAKEFIAAMARENVFVGRVWPSMPTWSRITVGTAEEMAKFKQAVAKVMA